MTTLDLGLAKALLKEDGLNTVLESGVDEFLQGDGKDVFVAIRKHYGAYGCLPDLDVLKRELGGLVVSNLAEAQDQPLTYFIAAIRKRTLNLHLDESLREVIDDIKSGKPENALDRTKELVHKAGELKLDKGQGVNLTKDVDYRIKRYEYLKELGDGIDGWRFPWPTANKVTQGMHPGEVTYFVGKTWSGKCISEDMRVYSPQYCRSISVKDCIDKKTNVLTFDKATGLIDQRPTNWIHTGRKTCLGLRTATGRELEVTPEHPLLTSTGWVCAENLKVGDRIAEISTLPEPDCTVELPEAELDFLAIILSEGSISGHHIGFSSSDADFVKLASDTACSLGLSIIKRSKYDYDFVQAENTGSKLGVARQILSSYGITYETAKQKSIPEQVFLAPNRQIAQFLRIFWWADGYVCQSSLVPGITLASEQLIDDIRELLLRFGISCTKRHRRIREVFDAWELCVRAASMTKFAGVFSSCVGEKFSILREYSGPRYKRWENVSLSSDVVSRIKDFVLNNESLIRNTFGITTKRVSLSYFIGARKRGNLVRRSVLRRLFSVSAGKFDDLSWLLNEDIFFVPVVEIVDVGIKNVYDLSVPTTHNFVAEGLVCHNTWQLMETMLPLLQDDVRILVITMEMPPQQLGRRLDSLMGRFKYDDLRKGRLSDEDFERYRNMLTATYSRLGDVWCYGPPRVRTVTDIEFLVQQHRPDALLVDGVYFLGGGGVSDRYLKVTHAAEEIKNMSLSLNIATLGTIQFTKEGSKGKRKNKMDADLEDVGYAHALSQSCDNMLGLFQSEDFKINKHLLVRFLKVREAGGTRGIVVNWDFETMNFSEVGIWTGDSVLPTNEKGEIINPLVADADGDDGTPSLAF